MTREQIAELVAQRVDAMNRHDSDALVALYNPECVVESPLAAGTVQGRNALVKVHQALFDAFPDLTYTTEDVLIDGDRVAVTGILMGTSTGMFMGLPPSGKPIRVPVVTISTVQGGLIVRERRTYDFTGMLMQIGVLKARPA